MNDFMHGFADELTKTAFIGEAVRDAQVKSKTNEMKAKMKRLMAGGKKSSGSRSGLSQAGHGAKDVAVGTGRVVGQGAVLAGKGLKATGEAALKGAGAVGTGVSKALDSDVGKVGAGAVLMGLLGRKALRRVA